MSEPPRPGTPGYRPGQWESFALNVGLKQAANTGQGLPLFNALRSRFGGVAQKILGAITSIIGQGLRAVFGLQPGDMSLPVNLENLPTVPTDFHPGEPGDRVLAGVTLTFNNQKTGEEEFRTVWVNALEVLTPEDLLEEARALFDAAADEEDSDKYKDLMETARELIFLAKRY